MGCRMRLVHSLYSEATDLLNNEQIISHCLTRIIYAVVIEHSDNKVIT